MNSATETGGGGSLQAARPPAVNSRIVMGPILIRGLMSYKSVAWATDSRYGTNHSIGPAANFVGEFAIRPSTDPESAR